jgi:glycine cleavage system H lipoate-binding protein
MRCPFLREAQVKFCRGAVSSKMIMRTSADGAHERCTSDAWPACAAARQHHQEHAPANRCPFLHESLVQYCAAAPVSKFVPYSDDPSARCLDDRHGYCDVLLSLEGGRVARSNGDPATWVPDQRLFTPNHLWLDIAPDGHWHLGVDAFFGHVAGRVDAISFLQQPSASPGRPTAVLTVGGLDLQVVFPIALTVTATNTRLRSQCERLISEPYTGGWLFEGTSRPGTVDLNGLRSGKPVQQWMTQELHRLTTVVQVQAARSSGLWNDGGVPVTGVLRHLDRPSALSVYAEFFSPFVAWRSAL